MSTHPLYDVRPFVPTMEESGNSIAPIDGGGKQRLGESFSKASKAI